MADQHPDPPILGENQLGNHQLGYGYDIDRVQHFGRRDIVDGRTDVISETAGNAADLTSDTTGNVN